MVDAGRTNAVEAAQVYLDFDPKKLEVLAIRPSNILGYELQSAVSHSKGQVDYAAGTLAEPVGTGSTLLSVDFLALSGLRSGPAKISYAPARPPRQTRAILGGRDTTGFLTPATVIAK